MSKAKSDDELETLQMLVKKKPILLNSYFGCSSGFMVDCVVNLKLAFVE